MLSDVVAERLIELRKAARLSREEFAERCRQLGMTDFTAASLGNIETGRRDKEGRRRRKIDVDEAPVFAAALGVPLVWLFADPASTEPVTVFGETRANPWRALGWMTGAWPLDEPDAGPAWAEASSHLGRVADLYMAIQHYDLLRDLYDPRYHPEAPVGMSEEESKRNGLKAILDRLDGFRITGMPMPPVPDHIHEGITELIVDRMGSEIDEVAAKLREMRAVGDEWARPDVPGMAQRKQTADAADAKMLRRLSETLRRAHNWGLPLPPLPHDVTDRAKELDVNLTPWLEAQ